MARTLTNLTPALYTALDVVSRELVGFIPAVSSDMAYTRAAVGQTVYSPVSVALSAGDISPAVTPPDDGDNTPSTVSLSISKARRVPVRINGEQELILNSSVGWMNIRAAEFAQAMRVLVNEIEADLAALYAKSSRAYGSAGTAPFGSTPGISDLAFTRKILADNGAPMTDLQCVVSTAAGANLRSLSNLYKANEAGGTDLLRRGVIGDLHGFVIRESAQVKSHNKGAGAAYDVDLTAGYGVGSTTIHMDGGTVNTTGIKAGDVVTFVGDSNKYIVTTGTTEVEADIVLGAPGLRATLADTVEMTIGDSYTANMAFSKSAIYLATRAPAVPGAGDLATDAIIITDPVSGLSFEVREYMQYRQVQYEVAIAWGVACVKPAHCAILLG